MLASNGDVNILSNSQTTISNQNYLDKSDRTKERGNVDNTNITNISSIITSGSDLNIISGNNTVIQSSKLSSGDNLTIDAKNNLLLLTAKDIAIKNETSTNKATYTFTNGSSGYVNNNLNSNNIDANLNLDLNSNTNPDLNNLNPNTNLGINSNLTLNANNSIIVQYQEGTMENLISSANDNNNSQLAYLKTLDNLSQSNQQNNQKNNPNKITLNKIVIKI